MRRTPTLTKRCREMFAEAYLAHGWIPGGTVRDIAQETGLSTEQVQDAIWNPPADVWRREMIAKRRKVDLEDAG